MAYTPPDGDAADFTWVGQEVYTAPDGDAADFAFPVADPSTVPVSTYALSVLAPAFPVQPTVVSLVLGNLPPELDTGYISASPSYALTSATPLLDAAYVQYCVLFGLVTPTPWIMPMTTPVYPPTATASLAPANPEISVHGLWSPADAIFGWDYDDGTDTVSIPLTSLYGLTAAAANATTGDWRAVLLSLLNTLWDNWFELTAPPKAVTVVYNPGTMQINGRFAGYVYVEYDAAAYLNFPEKTLADEPPAPDDGGSTFGFTWPFL